MHIDPASDRTSLVETTPVEDVSGDGMEVLLHRFLGVLNGIEPQIARRMHEEINSRFGGRYCSEAVCRMMADLVNGYLASELQPRLVPVRVRSSE